MSHLFICTYRLQCILITSINFSICDYCDQVYGTSQGLEKHQSKDSAKNFGCHRVQVLRNKEATRNELSQRRENIKCFPLRDTEQ